MWDKNADAGMTENSGAVRAMAGMLAERGFEIHRPNRVVSFCFSVANAERARCQIDIDEQDRLGWEYVSCGGNAAGPAEISGVVLQVLCEDVPESGDTYSHLHKGVTLKGAVGREMVARGLSVTLNTYEDTECFDSISEVEIANPARPERGVVFVGDEGIVQWDYLDYQSETGIMAAVADLTAQVLIPAGAAAE